LGVGFCPCTRLYRADAAALLHPLLFTHVRAHKFTDTGCNVRVRACTCMSGLVFVFCDRMCLSRAPALSVLVFARAERRIQQDLVPCADFCVMIQQHRGLGNVCTTCAVQYVYHCTSACRVLNRGGVGFSACALALWERRVAVPQAISYPITLA
jgi:hypothetical protein